MEMRMRPTYIAKQSKPEKTNYSKIKYKTTRDQCPFQVEVNTIDLEDQRQTENLVYSNDGITWKPPTRWQRSTYREKKPITDRERTEWNGQNDLVTSKRASSSISRNPVRERNTAGSRVPLISEHHRATVPVPSSSARVLNPEHNLEQDHMYSRQENNPEQTTIPKKLLESPTPTHTRYMLKQISTTEYRPRKKSHLHKQKPKHKHKQDGRIHHQ